MNLERTYPAAGHWLLAIRRPSHASRFTPPARVLALALFLSLTLSLFSQDVHFSQFHLSPLTLNPALAGAIDDDHRAVVNYRDQWRSFGSPFTTYAASYDLPILKGKLNGRYIGIGVNAFSDKAGKSQFGDTHVGLSIAYDLLLSKRGHLTFGMNGAYGQRSAQLANLSWDSQYTGTNYDPSLPTGEAAFNEQVSYVDLAAGTLWRQELKSGAKLMLGAAVHHPHQPTVALIGNGSDRLLLRSTVHGELIFDGGGVRWSPQFYVSKQGGAIEAVVGTMVERRLGADSRFTTANTSSSFQLGAFYRYADAVIPAILFDYHHMLSFGISYDINISSLHAQTSYQGGLEVALMYHGMLSDKRKKLKKTGTDAK